MLSILSGALPGGQHRYDQTLEMWRGHERSLCRYTDAVVVEMRRRGYYEELRSPLEDSKLWQIPEGWLESDEILPSWVGQERLHASHRATLLSEDRAWYAQMAWMEPARRETFTPRPMPRAGETVLHADGRVALVLKVDDHAHLLIGKDRSIVPRHEMTCGLWRRCQTAD